MVASFIKEVYCQAPQNNKESIRYVKTHIEKLESMGLKNLCEKIFNLIEVERMSVRQILSLLKSTRSFQEEIATRNLFLTRAKRRIKVEYPNQWKELIEKFA